MEISLLAHRFIFFLSFIYFLLEGSLLFVIWFLRKNQMTCKALELFVPHQILTVIWRTLLIILEWHIFFLVFSLPHFLSIQRMLCFPLFSFVNIISCKLWSPRHSKGVIPSRMISHSRRHRFFFPLFFTSKLTHVQPLRLGFFWNIFMFVFISMHYIIDMPTVVVKNILLIEFSCLRLFFGITTIVLDWTVTYRLIVVYFIEMFWNLFDGTRQIITLGRCLPKFRMNVLISVDNTWRLEWALTIIFKLKLLLVIVEVMIDFYHINSHISSWLFSLVLFGQILLFFLDYLLYSVLVVGINIKFLYITPHKRFRIAFSFLTWQASIDLSILNSSIRISLIIL